MKAMYETFQDRSAQWVKGDQRLSDADHHSASLRRTARNVTDRLGTLTKARQIAPEPVGTVMPEGRRVRNIRMEAGPAKLGTGSYYRANMMTKLGVRSLPTRRGRPLPPRSVPDSAIRA